MEPNGQEFTLETTNQRATTIIARKSPNNWTLMQRTTSGLAVIELTDEARHAVGHLLGLPSIDSKGDGEAFRNAFQGIAKKLAEANEEPRRRGRPPKSVGEST